MAPMRATMRFPATEPNRAVPDVTELLLHPWRVRVI
jgi:hypothetical protein